jgi:hypothetical protein
MDISRLTFEQHATLNAQIKRIQTYLERLRARLDQRRFADDDEFLLATVRAYRAIGDLSAYLHFHPPHKGPEGSDLPF